MYGVLIKYLGKKIYFLVPFDYVKKKKKKVLMISNLQFLPPSQQKGNVPSVFTSYSKVLLR